MKGPFASSSCFRPRMADSPFRRWLQRRPWAPLLGVVVGAIVVLSVLANSPAPPAPASGFPAVQGSCATNDSQVPDPSGVHGLYVLDPPTSPHGNYYTDVGRYLIPNPDVCGADLWVRWNSIDQGPGATPEYNFSRTDAALAPWVAAGKVVNLIFWSVGYGANSTYVPSGLLAGLPTIQCGSSAVTPLFWKPAFEDPYRAFVRAAVAHYGDLPGVGYLRFGLGTGGEVFPLADVTAPGCEQKLNATGFTVAGWDAYLTSMIQFEASLDSPHPLFVGLNSAVPGTNDNVSAVVSAAAAAHGMGIGSQGLQASAVVADPITGAPACNGGWCHYFNEYQGQIPLELQTLGPSEANGSGPVGPLPPLLSYGLAEHAQVFELYYNDWLLAFDPAYPGYAQYHTAYAAALNQAAVLLGTDTLA